MANEPASGEDPRSTVAGHGQWLQRWQETLLPVMVGMVAAITAFFLLASLVQLYSIHGRITSSPVLDLAPAHDLLSEAHLPGGNHEARLAFAKWKTLAILEGHTLERRYHQANVLLMARVWVRYLGFVTGMILALLGAVFVMARLREPVTQLAAEGHGMKGTLATSSPGIVLVVLGTGLMLATIVTHNPIDVQDAPPYTADWNRITVPSSSARPPADVQALGPTEQESVADTEDLLDEVDERLKSNAPAKGGTDSQ